MPMWCVAPLEMNEGNSMGQGYNRPTGCSNERPHTRPLKKQHYKHCVILALTMAVKMAVEEDCPECLHVLLPLATIFRQSNFRDADMFDRVDHQNRYDVTGPLWVHISDLAPRFTSRRKGKLQGCEV